METVFAHTGQLMVVHCEQQRVRQRRQAPLHQEPRPADWHPIIPGCGSRPMATKSALQLSGRF